MQGRTCEEGVPCEVYGGVLGNDIDIILRDSEGDRSLDEAQLLPGGAQLGGVLAGDLESTVV